MRQLCLLILGAVVLQFALLTANADIKPQADEVLYIRDGLRINAGKPLVGLLRPPGYPYLAALGQAVRPADTTARFGIGLVQIALSALTMVAIYLLARDLYDRRAGWVAAGIVGLYPPLAAQTHLLWSDLPCMLPISVALWLMVRARRRESLASAVAAGAFWGLAALTREFSFWFLPIACVWLGFTWLGPRRFAAAGLVAVGAFLVILPWTARNYVRHDTFVLIAANSWTPLLLATDALDRVERWRYYGSHKGDGMRREKEARARALSHIAEAPVDWAVRQTSIGLPALLSLENHVLRHLRMGWYGDVSPGRKQVITAVMVLGYLILLVSFAFGVSSTRWDADRLLVLLFLLYAGGVVTPMLVVARYRIPLEVVGSVFAGAWLARSAAMGGRSRGGRLVAAVVLAAFLIGVGFVGGGKKVGVLLGVTSPDPIKPLAGGGPKARALRLQREKAAASNGQGSGSPSR